MKTEKPIAIQIVDYIRTEKLDAGSHLPAQRLADFLHVSRSPINEALKLLHEKGILRREPPLSLDVDEHGLACDLVDREGNPVRPVFSTDEHDFTSCSDCGARI